MTIEELIKPVNGFVLVEPILRESAFEADAKYYEKGIVKAGNDEFNGKTVYFKKWNAARYDEEKDAAPQGFWLVPVDKIMAVQYGTSK